MGDSNSGSMRQAYWTLSALTAMNLLNYVDRYILAAVLAPVRDEFHLTNDEAGSLIATFFISYAVFCPVMGWLGDRFTRKYLLAIGVGLWSLATFGSGLARTSGEMHLARSLLGIGEASYATLAPTLIADLFPTEKRNRALTIFYLAIPIGASLGYGLGGLVYELAGWRMAFFLVGLPGLVVAVATLALKEPKRGASEIVHSSAEPGSKPLRLHWRDYLQLAFNPSYVYNLLAMAAMTFALGGLQAWVPTYLSEARGMDLGAANLWLAVVVASSALAGTPMGGVLGDWLSPRYKGAYFWVSGLPMLIAVPFIALALGDIPRIPIFICIFIGLTLAVFNFGPSNAIIINVTTPGIRAAAFAINTFLIHFLGEPPPTSFDKGIANFTWLMIRFMLVMVPLVFFINGFFKDKWWDAFMFALAVCVGLTPEMLPMIVSVCLSKGALLMSKKKVIVKRLNSIQNLGAMDVLCTDKTGTLTMDRVILEKSCDVVRKDDKGVLEQAFLNSHFQTGLKNVLDRAILQHEEVHQDISIADHAKADEIPFDFNRKMMSVVVAMPGGKHRLICKGAPESVFTRCTQFELEGQLYPMDPLLLDELKEEYDDLSADGFRVLAIAYRDSDPKPAYGKDDEHNLILKGYVAFLDPPKDSAGPAIVALQKHGVAVKVLTGDNELVSRKICKEVGLPLEHVLNGPKVEGMNDAELADAAERTTLFVRLSPAHKQRIIKALQGRNHVVGFIGDGINDSPALRAADVGISVDTAVDIAKEAADAILLEKSLMVLEEGVIEGRKVFANILKYVRMGASSSFGNMFSMLGASVWLPYLPMRPIQILTNNLLYDFSQVPIPTDEVDPEQVAKPRPWSMRDITRFILFIGPCSSVFDYTTFCMMWFIFKCYDLGLTPPENADSSDAAALFQTGWFVESLLTQTLIIHVIRTNKIPFIQSRASLPLILTTLAIMLIGAWLPFSPIGSALGFVPLPGLYWPLVLLTLLAYVLLTQVVKMWLVRKMWI